MLPVTVVRALVPNTARPPLTVTWPFVQRTSVPAWRVHHESTSQVAHDVRAVGRAPVRDVVVLVATEANCGVVQRDRVELEEPSTELPTTVNAPVRCVGPKHKLFPDAQTTRHGRRAGYRTRGVCCLLRECEAAGALVATRFAYTLPPATTFRTRPRLPRR